MEDLSLITSTVAYLTGLPSSIVGLLFGAGMLFRSKLRDYKDKQVRVIKTEVEMQLDFIYSSAYKEMESRVYYLHHKGETSIEVRHREDIEKVPFGAYKTGYKDSLKEVAFKQVLPCILAKIEDDKKHYKGKRYQQYVQDTGEDIQATFVGALGRKVGITEFSQFVEEDALNVKRFVDMYGKIIRRARGK